MLILPSSVQIFLASSPVDLRKGFDGLMALVKSSLKRDAFSGHLFCFIGKGGDKVKVLFWDRSGFVIYWKRLERGRFRIPKLEDGSETITLESHELSIFLEGLDVRAFPKNQRWCPPSVAA